MRLVLLCVLPLVLACATAATIGVGKEEDSTLTLKPIYSVEHCSDPAFNGFYICGSIGHCDHAIGKTSLVALHKFINNSVQKVWYLKNVSGTNAYGSIEMSAMPWATQPWKKIKGAVEPLLSVQPLDMQVCHRNRAARLGLGEAIRGLWLVLFALPGVPLAHTSAQTHTSAGSTNTLERFTLLADHASGCAAVLLDTSIDMLSSSLSPPSDAVAVMCDWLHLSFGWSSHAASCFHYLDLRTSSAASDVSDVSALSDDTADTLLPSPAAAAEERAADLNNEGAVLLASLREVQQYTASGDRSESSSSDNSSRSRGHDSKDTHTGAHTGVSPPDPQLHLHMTPFACFRAPLAPTGMDKNLEGGEAAAQSRCVLQYSLLQYATGLLKYEFNPRASLRTIREILLQSSAPVEAEAEAVTIRHAAAGSVQCVEIILEFLSGMFDDYLSLKEDFQRGECFASCQSLAQTPSAVKAPPLSHPDAMYSSVADSLHMACYTLNKRGDLALGQQDRSVDADDLITMTNSLLAIGAVVSASDMGRAMFQNYFRIDDAQQQHVDALADSLPAGKQCEENRRSSSGSDSSGSSSEDDRIASLRRLSCMFHRTSASSSASSACMDDVETRLASGDWKQLRSSPQLFSFYLSMTLQVHSTEMLSSRHEATVTKRLLAREMRTMAELCEAAGDCAVDLELLTPAVRGLFLLAYQGEEYAPSEEVDYDWSIPHSYYRILKAAHSHSLSPLPSISSVPAVSSSQQRGDTRIRVAFLSAYFFRHSVGRLMGNMVLSLDRSRFHVTILCARKAKVEEGKKDEDDLTRKLKRGVDKWLDLSLSFSRDITAIRDLHCDVLVFGDLLMHAFTAHLASQRLAPLQVAFWGHPFSAASSTVDYFISSDGFQEPWSRARRKAVVSTEHYEQAVLMQSFSANVLADREYETGSTLDDVFEHHHHLGTREEYLEYVTSRGFDLFQRPFGYGWTHTNTNNTSNKNNATRVPLEQLRVYTCLQSSMKMHPLFDGILAELLLQDPHAVIILLSSLKAKYLPQLKLQRRLLHALLQAGADPSRILFMPQIPSVVYSQIVCGGDVTLDPVPFGGGVTLSDSVRCNVPFITSGALQRVHRLGHGMALQLQLPCMTADNASSYVQHAVALAEEVSLCRQHIAAVRGLYSTCYPIDSDEPHVLSTCRIRHALCARKLLLYETGNIDFGGEVAGRNAVTEEWELFLARIVRSL